MTCKECEKYFCRGDETFNFAGFCSDQCRLAYFDKNIRRKMLRFVDSLNIDQKRMILEIEDKYYDYEDQILKLIRDSIDEN